MQTAKTCALLVIPILSFSCATSNISELEAVRIAERELSKEYGEKAVTESRSFQATLSGDKWEVLGYDSPEKLGGPFVITVDARTGKAEVGPILMTDPEKFERLYRERYGHAE